MILGLVPVIAAPAFAATSGTLTGLTDENIGLSFTGDADNAWSANGTTITGAVTSTGGTCSDTSHQSKLTIKNNKDIKATLSFDYAIEQNSGTIQVDGKGVPANGSYSVELDSGASKTVYIKSGSTSAATKITITNISLVSDVSVTVTFVPAENGTYSVDGKTITEAWENTQKATQAYELVATPDAGYMFLGWYRYNLDNKKCMSTNASAKLKIESDCSFAAKFVPKGTALFETGGQPFADLNDAVNYAKDNNKDKITLIADGAISGNYDIPAGITLLIPFDNAGTLYTDSPAAIRETPASNPFRTLTMTAGSSITVNGAMSIGGRYYAAGGGQQGRPVGDHGYIKMASGSSITVKNGGNLYVWGFISGDGSVTAESGATVYEFYQIADFRGGSASSNMGNKVFPFSQYFIQNIEVPLTLNAGATEKVFSGVYAMSTTYTTTINFIGSGGMFNIKSGSFTKDYDESTDRLILTVNGEAELNTLALKLAGMSVNSASYVLPITNNITINIDSGSVTINQDTALLAGVEVNIAEGAGLTVASGKNVYVYDADEWTSDNFVWGPCKFKSVAYAPGKAYDRSDSDLTDAKINVDGTLTAIGAVYTTAGGADICSGGGTGKYIQQGTPGTQTTTYQYNGSSVCKDIPITPAKLRNADGTYFETATVKTGTTVNYYKDGGIWHVHTAVPVPPKDATCTEKGNTAGTKCSVCNTILSGVEEIPAKGHQWDEGSITTAPTCTEDGVKTFTCLVCDGTKTEKVEKKGHISAEAVRENEIKSTCTVKGSYDEVVYCKECGKELSRVTKTIDALGHTPGEAKRENVVEPSCMVDGRYEEVVYCSVCNDEISRVNKTIDATGHTPVEVPEVPATCTKPGTAAGTKCDVCGEELSGFEAIPPAGHQWDEGKVTTEPTCEGTGVKTFTCSNCQEKRYEDIPATGHQWDEGKVTTEPKCEEAGVKTYTCSVCDETKTEAIDATGHTPVDVAAKDATCTEKGNTAGTKCSVCDKILSGVEEIPAKGHTPGKAVKESVVLATCEAAGSYEEVVYCEVCKEELTRVSKTLPAMGHTRGEAVRENVIDSTCADEGSCDEVVYCEVCKKELSREAKVIEKKAHTPVDVAEVPATCTEPGTTVGTKCDVCGTILSGVKEIPANGHTEVIRNAKPATDTEDGYTGDVYCEVCNELLRNGEVIPATHVKITWIINGVKHETVCAKGEIPVYDGETPAKPETSRFTYEFKGWDKEIVAATENAEYTAEFTAIGKNGLCIEGNDTFWIKNGVNIAFPGLIRIADENGHIHYYYFAEDGKAVKNGNYKVNKNNGLPLPEYGFAFDSDGVIVHDEDTSKNGICDGDGSKFYYIDGVKVGEGLIKVGDYYYYARTSSGEIVRNRQYWITKTNELPIQQGIFDFDAEGRMIVTGFIHAFGATYYYDNGVLAKGFTKIGDDYYIFNASSGKMYSNATMWVPDNEYGITGGMYEFDADGKMIRTGFITTGGYTYYYDNGVLAKGFTKIGDDYYFFNAGSGKMYRDATLWVADNAEYGFVGGMYYFGADGKMVLPDIENGKKSIVTINGKKYLTIDGAYAPTGLYEIDGNCYYVKAAGELAVGETVWVDNKNGLIPAKGDWRAFDAEGKLIHTGFVTGGDGYVYHYTDDVLSLGFTCIDGEYYLFNAGSGKMYRDANMWVGPNDYGIVGGMYYFDANGKMAR